MRRTKEDAAITREQLLRAAMHCFRAQGYAATTLDDIARQAGTTRGAIHWHFGNKARLYNTLVRERYQQAARVFAAIPPGSESPLEQLREVLLRWLAYPEEEPEFRAVLELQTLKTEVTPELEEGMQENIQGQRYSLDYFATLIQKGMSAGEIQPTPDAQTMARIALAMINGLTSQWLMDHTAFSLKQIAPHTVDLFIRGIARH